MVKHRVGDLKHCPELYPRLSIDSEHVQRMVEAIEAGAALPPIIVCRRTLRMADGNHRASAWQRRFGDDEEIECVEKDYKNDAAFFLDAIHLNGEHGLVLGPQDRQRSMEIASELKIDPKRCAGALRMTVDAAGELRTRVIINPTISANSRPHPFKRNGKDVPNPGRQRAEFTSRLDRIIRFLEGGDFDPEDIEVRSRLEKIDELFRKLLAGWKPKEVGQTGPSFRITHRGKPVGALS